MESKIVLNGKYIIRGRIRLVTGTRIGGTEIGFAIGGVDNPIIRNPVNGEPYIPGSSLKGKMRALMEKVHNKELNRKHTSGGKLVRRHECDDPRCIVCRLFGASEENNPESGKSNESRNIPARIIVRDAFLTEDSKRILEVMETDTPYAEIKSENALDRITAFSSPRQVERIPAGVEFEFEIIYSDVEFTSERFGHVKVNAAEDLMNIMKALELLEEDYIGGYGSRGYGKVQFIIHELVHKPREYYAEHKNVVKDIVKSSEGLTIDKALEALKSNLR